MGPMEGDMGACMAWWEDITEVWAWHKGFNSILIVCNIHENVKLIWVCLLVITPISVSKVQRVSKRSKKLWNSPTRSNRWSILFSLNINVLGNHVFAVVFIWILFLIYVLSTWFAWKIFREFQEKYWKHGRQSELPSHAWIKPEQR